MFRKSASIIFLLAFTSLVSADAQWTGPGYDSTPGAWEDVTTWNTAGVLPASTDLIVRAYRSDEGGSNITINTSVSGGIKLQMKYGKSKLTINSGGTLTNSGVVEMFLGTSSEVEIKAGGTWNACTSASGAIFNLTTSSASKDTVSVWGTLNVSGSSNPQLIIGTTGNSAGQGTVNIYGGGVVNADGYTIGSHGIIKMWAGGIFKIKGDVTEQTSPDITAGKIAGQDTALTTYYNSDENMTYVVPEPATVALLGLGSLTLLRKRK